MKRLLKILWAKIRCNAYCFVYFEDLRVTELSDMKGKIVGIYASSGTWPKDFKIEKEFYRE